MIWKTINFDRYKEVGKKYEEIVRNLSSNNFLKYKAYKI